MKNKSTIYIAIILLACASMLALGASGVSAQRPQRQNDAVADAKEQIAAFNEALRVATVNMDNSATMALWDDDGTTLLPGQAAVSGKANIAKWLDGVTANLKGWKVLKQEQEFHDIQVSGDWTSEWATTAQTVQPPDGKPAFTTHGKMLLVLRRGRDGKWKVREEAWNSAQ